jgi:glycine dehydrogenase subunit 1
MRYLPLTPQDRQDMLREIGATSINDLFAGVPKDKLLNDNIPTPK